MGIVMSMGASMASALGSCLCGSAASCVCAGLKAIMPSGYQAAKVYALILFFASVVTALILRGTKPSIDAKYFKVECTGEYEDRCYGYQAVYRISFVDFFFYLAIALGSKFSVGFHTHAWGLKYLVFIGSVFGMFFVKDDVFNGYVHLARIASLLYLVAQVVTLINFSYNLHTSLMAKAEAAETNGEENSLKFYKGIYLALSLLCLGGGITGIGLLYAYYASCRISQFWITMTLLVSLACLVSSLLDKISMGLLTPSFLFLYFDYMCWSAILSNPSLKCNSAADVSSSPAKEWETAISLIFLAISLTYTGWSTYQSIAGGELREEDAVGSINADPNLKKVLTGEEGGAATVAAKEEGGGSTAAASATAGEEEGNSVPNLTSKDQAEASLIWIFHLLMALAGSYMAMSITNWGHTDGKPEALGSATIGVESMWLKIVAQWLTMILYAWSLWAPVCRGEVDE